MGGLNTFGYVEQKPNVLFDLNGLSYREHGQGGHSDLITYPGANVDGWIADMPDHTLDGYSTVNFNCKKIPTPRNTDFQGQAFATVCAGSGAPPAAIKGNHGDLDFVNIDGRWSKISGQWIAQPGQDIFGLGLGDYTSCHVDPDESAFPWFMLPVHSIRIGLLYRSKDLSKDTGIKYINRIRNEIWENMPKP